MTSGSNGHANQPVRGALAPVAAATPFALFLFVLAAAVTTRLWRVVDLVAGEAPAATLLWLPLLIGRDLLLAVVVAAVAIAFVAARLPAVVAVGTAGVVAVLVVLWRSANVLCYRVLQGPITLPRVTGNEGARATDIGLLEWRDVWPIAFLALALLAVLPLAMQMAQRTSPHRRAVALGVALALGALLTVADSLVLRRYNFGLADEPVAIFLESCVIDAGHTPLAPVGRAGDDEPTFEELEAARTPAVGGAPGEGGADDVERHAPFAKNVIVFFAEGIPREYTGLASPEVDTTPNLQRRAAQAGLEFERYYSHFHKSILAIFSAVCSEYPPPTGKNITLFKPRIDCGELSEVTSDWGVHAGLFHAGEFAFYDKLGLLGARGYEVHKDAVVLQREAIASGRGPWEETSWGVDDRAMVQATLDWIDSLPPDDRFVANVIPLSPHYPYLLPSDVPLAPEDEGIEGDRYIAALQFLDLVFEQLMVGLEERGLADDTAVIFVADHGENLWEPLRQSPGKRLAYDNNLHVPFVIFHPKMFPTRQTSMRPGGHIDLLPTVLDLLGLPPVPQHRGQSLLSPDWTEKRIFFAALNGLENYVGFHDGWTKIIVNVGSGRAEKYDLRADPEEMNDLFDETSADDRAMAADALAFHRLQTHKIATAPVVSERLDLERRVAESLTARLVTRGEAGEQVAPCPGGVCPGSDEPLVLGARDLRVAGRKRSCVAVRVPEEGELELEVTEPAVLSLLSFVRFGLGPVGVRPARAQRLRIFVDDTPVIERQLTRSHPHRKTPFETPHTSLRIRVSGEAFDGVMCLAFSNTDWT